MWGNQGTTFGKPFLDTLAVNYGTGMRVTDFAATPEPSRIAINGWTSRQTEQRINDLIPQGAIDTDTRLVLVNAVYFNAEWVTKFDPQRTSSKSFVRADGTSKNVDTMSRLTDFRYAEGDGYQAVELAYAGRAIPR